MSKFYDAISSPYPDPATDRASGKISESTSPEDGLDSRHVALIILGSVLNARQPLGTVFEINPEFDRLNVRDKAFIRMLVTTTLRRLGEIDALIARAQTQSNRLQPVLENILRLGIAQILFLNVPDHAAVDTSVRLAEREGMAGFKGLVNGILRNLIRHYEEWSADYKDAHVDIPEWLYDTWVNDYGAAIAERIAQASLSEACVDLTAKSGARAEEIASALGGTVLWNGTIRLKAGGLIPDLEGYQEGSWWVQDISASLPVSLLPDLNAQEAIDLCAAPGGKTAQLAARGAHVQALDRSARRLSRFMTNMKRLRFEEMIEPVSADAQVWQPREPVDLVLLDAPCSATGTIRRNPDVLYLKTERDIEKLAHVQRNLLKNATNMVKPGGMLIYCTCSLQKQECEDQIERFINGGAPFRRMPVTPEEVGGHEEFINEEGDLRLFPFMMEDEGGMDGFYVARLLRL